MTSSGEGSNVKIKKVPIPPPQDLFDERFE
jgi:hypothetical protein